MEYGLIGKKLGHSFSKEIHAAFSRYRYELKEIPEDRVVEFLSNKDFKGINVTIPYKETVIPYLNFVSDQARKIGSVNTVINRNGLLYGYNTDYFGFNYMLRRAGISVGGKVVAILGTGGASKTAKFALSDAGAKEIITVSRRGDVNYENIKSRKDLQIIINASPAGMYPDNGTCLIDLEDFPSLEGVADMVYNPYVTELLYMARCKGVKSVNGLPMLVAQAKYACELFADCNVPDCETEKIIKAVRKQTANITLIGMPGSGKTSVGKAVARILKRNFIDADSEFEKTFGISAGDYIETYGETAFRARESEVLAEISKESRKVISTGGGAVKIPKNVKNIKSNSVTVWIKRDIEKLAVNGRPLSRNGAELENMYSERAPLYGTASDIEVDNNGSLKDTVDALINELDKYDGE